MAPPKPDQSLPGANGFMKGGEKLMQHENEDRNPPKASAPKLVTPVPLAPAPAAVASTPAPAHRQTKRALDIPSSVSTVTAPSESSARLGSPSEPDQQHLTLKYLLLMLVQKSILSEDEGSALLGKLLN